MTLDVLWGGTYSICNLLIVFLFFLFFFFQAEDGIRDAQESRGLGDVYKRQGLANRFAGLATAGAAVDRAEVSHGT